MRTALWCLVGGNAGLLISAFAFGDNGNAALALMALAVTVHALYTTRGASC